LHDFAALLAQQGNLKSSPSSVGWSFCYSWKLFGGIISCGGGGGGGSWQKCRRSSSLLFPACSLHLFHAILVLAFLMHPPPLYSLPTPLLHTLLLIPLFLIPSDDLRQPFLHPPPLRPLPPPPAPQCDAQERRARFPASPARCNFSDKSGENLNCVAELP
jgi:hypothetical protein